ncbi:MAG TPA: DNA-3-methyladenine glycosylase I [Stellaceae bacterium]|nr:DNA-3-methyladenine glycosylase I [Stellaceae bacterium]
MSAAYCRLAPGHPFHGSYHASEYGFPSRDDAVLFERLVLEINQAGLSWLTVLKKRDAFHAAFAGYDIDKVAAFTGRDVKRLMNDEGIIRNRLKIEAAIENAKRLEAIRGSHGSFAAWLDAHHPLSKEKWVKLFKETFRFTGGEIVGEFLMSLGYLKGAHVPSCPVHAEVARLNPPWAESKIRVTA